MPTKFPACMMPDGAEPCKAFTALQEENERLSAIVEAAGGLLEEIIADGTHQRWKRVADLIRERNEASFTAANEGSKS